MADALEQPLLLSQDMADLRSLKKHEVFQTLKRDLAMVSKFFFFFFYVVFMSFYLTFSFSLFLRQSKQHTLPRNW